MQAQCDLAHFPGVPTQPETLGDQLSGSIHITLCERDSTKLQERGLSPARVARRLQQSQALLEQSGRLPVILGCRCDGAELTDGLRDAAAVAALVRLCQVVLDK